MTVQITLKATANGIDERWVTLRSEVEDDAVAIEILADALGRRFVTRPGTYITDPTYGLDLDDVIGTQVDDASITRWLLAMQQQAEAEYDRVERAQAVLVSNTGSGAFRAIVARLTVIPRVGQPFQLNITVTPDTTLTVQRLQLGQVI